MTPADAERELRYLVWQGRAILRRTSPLPLSHPHISPGRAWYAVVTSDRQSIGPRKETK